MEDLKLLTIPEASKVLGINVHMVRHLVNEGRIRSISMTPAGHGAQRVSLRIPMCALERFARETGR